MMSSTGSKTPHVVVVCKRTTVCNDLVQDMRERSPGLRITRIALCDFQQETTKLLKNETPPDVIIQVEPRATDYVDMVPSGVAHNFMNIARNILEGKPVQPELILYTSATDEEIEQMCRPITKLSGLPSEKVRVVRPGTILTCETLFGMNP